MKASLKEAEAAWQGAQNKSANDDLMATIEAEGRKPIMDDASKLPEVLNKVEQVVFGDHRNGLVLSHTQGLVTVQNKRPLNSQTKCTTLSWWYNGKKLQAARS